MSKSKTEVKIKDLNTATVEDLKSVCGIGATLSERIIKFRDRLGGFLVNEQLCDVYGLKPEVVNRALLQFQVTGVPSVNKININKAGMEELSQVLYINRSLASEIVRYRNINGAFRSFQELGHVDKFPTEKLDRIALYLSL